MTGETGWIFFSAGTGGYGVKANYAQGKGIVVQAGNGDIFGSSPHAGNIFGNTASPGSAPWRVIVRKTL